MYHRNTETSISIRLLSMGPGSFPPLLSFVPPESSSFSASSASFTASVSALSFRSFTAAESTIAQIAMSDATAMNMGR